MLWVENPKTPGRVEPICNLYIYATNWGEDLRTPTYGFFFLLIVRLPLLLKSANQGHGLPPKPRFVRVFTHYIQYVVPRKGLIETERTRANQEERHPRSATLLCRYDRKYNERLMLKLSKNGNYISGQRGTYVNPTIRAQFQKQISWLLYEKKNKRRRVW